MVTDDEIEVAKQNCRKVAQRAQHDALERRHKSREECFYHYIDMNLYHLAGMRHIAQRQRIALRILEHILITREIDHSPVYVGNNLTIPCIISDPCDILTEVSKGQSLIFCGFHTGPYWRIVRELVRLNQSILIVTPQTLVASYDSFKLTFERAKQIFTSQSTMTLLPQQGWTFLSKIKSAVAERKSVILFLDGYDRDIYSGNADQCAFSLLSNEISMLRGKNVSKLALLLRTPIAVFNTESLTSGSHELRLNRLQDSAKGMQENDHHARAHLIYSTLASSLASNPYQWEGWMYIHGFFRKEYIESLNRAPFTAVDVPQPRMFYDRDYGVVVDKLLLKFYSASIDSITKGRLG